MCQFQQIEKFIFNSLADSKTGGFGNMGNKINPQQISLFDPKEDRRKFFTRERERE